MGVGDDFRHKLQRCTLETLAKYGDQIWMGGALSTQNILVWLA